MKNFLLFIAIFAFSLDLDAQSEYCSPSARFDNRSNIEAISLIGVSSNITYNPDCPGSILLPNVSTMSADLIPGNTYTMSVTFGTCGANFAGVGEAWIDWDNSDSFESGESIGSSVGTPGTAPWDAPVDFTFTVPSSFSCATRMRVVQREGGSLPLSPCGSVTRGTIVDFIITENGETTYTYYADTDLDTYGDSRNLTVNCSPTPPNGYVTNSSDCWDMDAAVNVAPYSCVCFFGPFNTGDSNVETVNLLGENSDIAYTNNCPGEFLTVDQTAMVADVIPGNTYTVSVELGTCGGSFPGATEAWIDWNNDNIFEPGESVGSSVGTPGTAPWDAPVDFTFTVPSSFSCETLMRVVLQESVSPPLDPCTLFTYGSAIHFTIKETGSAAFTYYADVDMDTYGNPDYSIIDCSPSPPAGFVSDASDCDDTNPAVNVAPNTCVCEAGPRDVFGSNVESIVLNGDNSTMIDYTGCPGILGSVLHTETTDLNTGSTYTVSVTFGTCSTVAQGAGAVWIDWNNDRIFDASELIGESSGTPGTAPWDASVPFSFMVPTTAHIGNVYMRIMQQENDNLPLNPCSQFTAGSVDDFLINISTCAASTAVVLPTSGTTVISASESCQQGVWTYYEDPATPSTYLFAVDWDPTAIGGGHNDAAKAAATITIQVDASPNSASDATNGIFFMGRQWGVDLGAATLDGPVNIKYFYDLAEKAAAEAAATAHATANGSSDDGFEWFKQTTNVDFSGITDPAFQPDVVLAEAATGVENGVNFVQFDGIVSFSTGSGAASTGGTILPVEFISFTGKVTATTNLLEWATASEINSSHYEIQRAADGRNYVKIGTIEAAGNAIETLNYHFEDKNPIQAAYYRLKQVDLDGSYDFSKIIQINRPIEKGITIGQVRPNPAKSFATLEFNTGLASPINIVLTNVHGQVVSNRTLEAVTGLNKVELDLNALAAGVYFVRISNNNTKAVTRIVKTN